MKPKILAVIAASICTICTAQAEECVAFRTSGNFPNFAKVPTPNGYILVIYPRIGTPLPVKRQRLPDGSTVTGAVPGSAELSFMFLDKTSKARALRRIGLEYVTETATGNRSVEFKDANDKIVATGKIPGFPFLVPNMYRYIPSDFPPKIVVATFSIPGTLVMQYCVDPGDRIDVNTTRLVRKIRSR